MEQDEKRTIFDNAMISLFNVIEDTLYIKYGKLIETNKEVKLYSECKKYEKVYRMMTPEEHYKYLDTVYNSKRRKFLDVREDDDWLLQPNAVIVYLGQKKPGGKELRNRLPLSEVFAIARQIHDDAKAEDKQFRREEEVNIDKKILLHLFRIFYAIIDTQDRTDIGNIVMYYEKMLKETDSVVKKETSKGGFSQIIASVTDLLKDSGIDVSSQLGDITEEGISKMANDILKAPQTKEVMGRMVGSFANGGGNMSNMKDIFTSLSENIANPELVEMLQGTFSSATQTMLDTAKNGENKTSNDNNNENTG